jgi:alcohol dehydrogenase (cytochrome c)
VLSTNGGLVFFGEIAERSRPSMRADEPVWHFQTNQLWKASPMTYEVEGRQYVAIAAGSNKIAFALPAVQ